MLVFDFLLVRAGIIYIFPGVVWFVLQQMHRYCVPSPAIGNLDAREYIENPLNQASDEGLQAVPSAVIWQVKDVFFSFRGMVLLSLSLWGLVVLFVGTIATALGI